MLVGLIKLKCPPTRKLLLTCERHYFSRFISKGVLSDRLKQLPQSIRNLHFGNKKSGIKWPTVFFLGFSGLSFTTAMILEKEYPRDKYCNVMKLNVEQAPVGNSFVDRWNALSDNERAIGIVIGINILIMALWRVPFSGNIMGKLFYLGETSKSIPLLFSIFSHMSPLHLVMNAGIFWIFGVPLMDCIGLEQTMSIYLSGGIFSSLLGVIFKIFFKTTSVSMGATGASLAVMSAYCNFFPDKELTFFLPSLTCEALPFSKTLTILEFISLFAARYAYLDHAGNLGGLLFGMWYAKYGHEFIWLNRDKVQDFWLQAKEFISDTYADFSKKDDEKSKKE